MDVTEERRRFKRYDCSFRVSYATTDNMASIESYTLAKNISKGGIRLLVSRIVKKGAILRIRIFQDDMNDSLEVFGKVKWVSEELIESNLVVDAGVQFTEADPSAVDRLLATVQ